MSTFSTIVVRQQGEITVIEALPRRIYLQVVEAFRADLQAVIANTRGAVLLDLGKVSVMNSAGLGVLIAVHDQLQRQNRALVICNLLPVMAEIFSRMKLETLIPVAKSQEEGIKLLQEGTK
ncbi:MAG: STAS domain-containing protein [candidate division KSB1 bacterium]|nr:STAS domain-containing protein [candidate division KSB1 bacterium]MDZ7273327.1 STAS domain-containing protein [candidate division KSB1 bacterium]MDZ7287989.1 STAS domain-containing protein [candidate division KSB1 bacterium]MDZ7300159.1 STAS domain-containing protein [candidate division KSB1 bacterium]MDZ7309459.1 STAS domain-containing protein [candidate division KSB1 bacterium]